MRWREGRPAYFSALWMLQQWDWRREPFLWKLHPVAATESEQTWFPHRMGEQILTTRRARGRDVLTGDWA